MKRKLDEHSLDELDAATPKKRRTHLASTVVQDEDEDTIALSAVATPTKPRRGRPPGSKNKPVAVPNSTIAVTSSPAQDPDTATTNHIPSTPKKTREPEPHQDGTPTIIRNADRSARRKSAQTLIRRTISGGLSDDDDLDEEDTLARRIWDEDEDDGSSDQDGEPNGGPSNTDLTAALSKRPRGRPKGSRRKRTPTPPASLPPYERYFFQNRPLGSKTSNHTLASLSLLTHSAYFPLIENYADPHLPERTYLEELHARSSFGQWRFEMSQGFNVCLYGYGSKRRLVMRFAEWLAQRGEEGRIVVVNGYLPNVGVREILNMVAAAAVGPPTKAQVTQQKLAGATPAEMLDSLLTLLTSHYKNKSLPLITLLIHSLDSPSLRPPPIHSLLSTLSTHPALSLLATTDHPNAPLLWPTSLRGSYNFLFHDTTTFSPYDAEIDVVEAVEETLGRRGRRVGGREGLVFLLQSLPGNARRLFALLVAEILALQDGDGDDDDNDDESPHRADNHPSRAPGTASGIPYSTLYQKATRNFICSSDLTFRTLLKEFHDHQMITSRRDQGERTEMLHVPFSREELEGVMEDLVLD